MKPINRNQSEYMRKVRDFPTKVAKRAWKKFSRKAVRLFNKNTNKDE